MISSPEKVLITGCHGLLGQKLVGVLKATHRIYGVDLGTSTIFSDQTSFHYFPLDITEEKSVKELVRVIKPDVIINTAAYTDVDGCEKSPELCFRVNVGGVKNLVQAARGVGARVVQLSSDYVFDGREGPYREEDTPNPLGIYGKSKLESEKILQESRISYTIIRTMILYGWAKGVRANFVTWLLDRLKYGEMVRIVDDQEGNPTLADDLARAIKRVLILGRSGVYHMCGRERTSRYRFALKIARFFSLDCALIHPAKTDELDQKAKRPLKSGFILKKAEGELGHKFMNVEESLKVMASQMGC